MNMHGIDHQLYVCEASEACGRQKECQSRNHWQFLQQLCGGSGSLGRSASLCLFKNQSCIVFPIKIGCKFWDEYSISKRLVFLSSTQRCFPLKLSLSLVLAHEKGSCVVDQSAKQFSWAANYENINSFEAMLVFIDSQKRPLEISKARVKWLICSQSWPLQPPNKINIYSNN